MSIRSFIAIPLPSLITDALGDVAAQMAYQDKSNAVRWVDQANYHITIAFLGDQHEDDLERLAEQLDYFLPHQNFEISISHLSPFPEGRPKLIAAMVNKTEQLAHLHQQVMSALLSSPIRADKRRFIPHVTLGRYRHNKNHFAGMIPASMELAAAIEEVTLFESVLTPNGAEYEAVFRYPLEELELEFEIAFDET